MNAIIVALIVLGVLAAGVFILKKLRSNLLAERERRLKVAQGDFSDEIPQAAPVRRKRKRKIRWWGARPGDKPPVPKEQQIELLAAVPIATEAVLQARRAANQAAFEVLKADAEHAAVIGICEAVRLPAHPDKVNPRHCIAGIAESFMKLRQSQRQVLEKQRRYVFFVEEFARRKLELNTLRALEDFDQSNLEENVEDVLDLARRVVNVCVVRPLRERRRAVEELRPEPNVAGGALDEQLLQTELAQLLSAWSAAHAAHAFTKTEFLNLSKLQAGPTGLQDPAHPAEQDVQEFLTALLDWSKQVRQQDDKACAAAKVYSKVSSELAARLAQVRKTIADVCQAENQHLNATQSQAKPESNTFDSMATAIATGPSGYLTDAQHAWRDTASLLLSSVSSSLQEMDTTAHEWLKQSGGPTGSAELDNAVRSDLAHLSLAMRKLGFALAQRRSADKKLADFVADQIPEGSPEPALGDVNVEAFVRAHHKWSSDAARTKVLQEQRAQRLKQLAEQSAVRNSQLLEAAESLALTIRRVKDLGVGHYDEVDAILRAASLLVQLHKPVVVVVPSSPAAANPNKTKPGKSKQRR